MRIVQFIFLFLSITAEITAQSIASERVEIRDGKKYILHTVEKAQSLYAISKIYNTSINAIVTENPKAEKGISAGDILYIPHPSDNSIEKSNFKFLEHRVQKSETIYGISKKYGLKEGQLQKDNPELVAGLKEGMVLKIETSATQISTPSKGSNKELNPVEKTSEIQKVSNTDSFNITKPKTRKEVYNLALLLPLEAKKNLDFSVEGLILENKDFPFSTSIAVDFYEGIRMVVDSLNSEGKLVNLYLFEANEKDSLELFSLAQDSVFNMCDLVIGPLFQTGFKVVSGISKQKNIPLISPFTNSNKILFNNPLSSKVTPSNKSLAEEFALYCFEKLSEHKLVVVNSGKAKDQFFIKAFKTKFNELVAFNKSIKKDTLLEVKGISGSKDAFLENREMVYLVLSEDEVFVTDYMTQMKMFSNKKKEFKIFGMKKWIEMDHLDPEYLNALNFSFFTNQHVITSDTIVQSLMSKYRYKYKTDPMNYFFSGYDIANYYLRFLFQEGPSFLENLDKYPSQGLTTDFKFYRPTLNTGFENNAIRIIDYRDYKLIAEVKDDEK